MVARHSETALARFGPDQAHVTRFGPDNAHVVSRQVAGISTGGGGGGGRTLIGSADLGSPYTVPEGGNYYLALGAIGDPSIDGFSTFPPSDPGGDGHHGASGGVTDGWGTFTPQKFMDNWNDVATDPSPEWSLFTIYRPAHYEIDLGLNLGAPIFRTDWDNAFFAFPMFRSPTTRDWLSPSTDFRFIATGDTFGAEKFIRMEGTITEAASVQIVGTVLRGALGSSDVYPGDLPFCFLSASIKVYEAT